LACNASCSSQSLNGGGRLSPISLSCHLSRHLGTEAPSLHARYALPRMNPAPARAPQGCRPTARWRGERGRATSARSDAVARNPHRRIHLQWSRSLDLLQTRRCSAAPIAVLRPDPCSRSCRAVRPASRGPVRVRGRGRGLGGRPGNQFEPARTRQGVFCERSSKPSLIRVLPLATVVSQSRQADSAQNICDRRPVYWLESAV
jgi:hypothetical protein